MVHVSLKVNDEKKKPPTLLDVARLAGVSKITASRALRDKKPMKEATRQQVMDAAAKLGYRPNPLIQTLMTGVRKQKSVRSVGIAWVHAYTQKFPQPEVVGLIYEGAKRRAGKLGYDLYEFPLVDPKLTARRVDQILKARGIGGAIFSPLPNVGLELPFPWDEFPMSKIGHSIVAPFIHNCGVHHIHQMDLVIKKVQQRGYRRVAYLSSRRLDLRFEHSCTMAMVYYNTQIPEENRIPVETVDEWSSLDFKRWFEKYHPDAIIVDVVDIIERLQTSGADGAKNIPHVIYSLGIENKSSAGILHPFGALGSAAVDLVTTQMHRNERGIARWPKTLLLEGDWNEGNTLPDLKTGRSHGM